MNYAKWAGVDLKLFKIPRLYIETSVINGVFSKDVRIRVVSSVFFEKIRAGEIDRGACVVLCSR